MSRTTSRSVAFALCIALAAQQAAAYYVTYDDLTPYKGQWSIAVEATKTADKSVFEPQVCNATALDAPCIQPLLSHTNDDALRFTFTLKSAPLRTLDDLQPTKVVFRACYSTPFTKNRVWRKPAPEIFKDRSCPVVLSKPTSMDFQSATPYEFTYPISDNTTQATWYATIFVLCNNGTNGLTYCQYDNTASPGAQPTYWGTTQIQPITTGLKIATGLCSAVAPLFLLGFFLWEFKLKKQ